MKLILENWREFINEQKESGAKIVSFDFDDTLTRSDSEYEYQGPNNITVSLFKKFKNLGYKVFIVTTRLKKFETNEDRKSVVEFVNEQEINPDGIIFTNGEDKVHILAELGAILHFDDDEFEMMVIEKSAPHIKTVQIDYKTGDIINGWEHLEEIGI